MSKLRVTSTGWWGMPGQNNPTAKVHAVCDQKPICGAKFHPKAEYQFCCSGLNYSYVECSKCREIIRKDALAVQKATPLAGRKQSTMTEAQAVEEISRVSDNLERLELTVKRLKERLHTAWAVLVG